MAEISIPIPSHELWQSIFDPESGDEQARAAAALIVGTLALCLGAREEPWAQEALIGILAVGEGLTEDE